MQVFEKPGISCRKKQKNIGNVHGVWYDRKKDQGGTVVEQKTCYYCGTKYPLDVECCPLCGQTEVEPEAIDEAPAELSMDAQETPKKPVKGGARAAKRANVVSTIVCILLAVAVVAGALFILTSLGVLSFEKPPADDSSLTLPVDEQNTEPAEVLCTGIDLAPETAAFNTAGSTVTLIVTTEPAGCTEQVIFESADENVAVVSEDGKVTAVGNGVTEIIVSCGNFAKSMEVRCELQEEIPEVSQEDQPDVDVDAETLSLSLEDFSMFSAGETARISVVGIPEGAAVSWSSSNENVVVVKDGKVTAVGGGTATVKAAVGDVVLECIVRCKFEAAPGEVVVPSDDENAPFLSHDDVTVTAGETFVIRLVQNDARVQGVSWATTNASVCTVEADGTVTVHGSGMAKITGTYGGVTYSCIVRCN